MKRIHLRRKRGRKSRAERQRKRPLLTRFALVNLVGLRNLPGGGLLITHMDFLFGLNWFEVDYCNLKSKDS